MIGRGNVANPVCFESDDRIDRRRQPVVDRAMRGRARARVAGKARERVAEKKYKKTALLLEAAVTAERTDQNGTVEQTRLVCDLPPSETRRAVLQLHHPQGV